MIAPFIPISNPELVKEVSRKDIENNFFEMFHSQVHSYVKRWNIDLKKLQVYDIEKSYVIRLDDEQEFSIRMVCDTKNLMINVDLRHFGTRLHTINGVNEAFFNEGSPEELIGLIKQGMLNEKTCERKYDMQNVLFRNGLINSLGWNKTSIDNRVEKNGYSIDIEPKYDLVECVFNVTISLFNKNYEKIRTAQFLKIKIGNIDEIVECVRIWEKI